MRSSANLQVGAGAQRISTLRRPEGMISLFYFAKIFPNPPGELFLLQLEPNPVPLAVVCSMRQSEFLARISGRVISQLRLAQDRIPFGPLGSSKV